MADFPEIGLEAVIENLQNFTKAADAIVDSYDEMDKGASDIESTSVSAGGALTSMAGILSTTVVAAAAAAAAAIAGVAVGLGIVAKAAFDMASDVNSATNNIQTDLGVTEEEAARLGEIATDIWANNFGESVNEVSEALVIARQRWEDINDLDLQNAVEDAFRLRDAFGVDIVESMNAADELVKNFGITHDQAFDFITKGFQKGLDSSDDFIDSITEYSNLFGEADARADQFFSVMDTGLAGGVLGTDKALDLFKEFQIRFLEGGDDISDAVGDMGMSYDGWIEDIISGNVSVTDAFDDIIASLNEIDDPIERNRLGVALMGTQFEDLGQTAVLGISTTTTSLEEMQGATDTLNKQYDNLGDLWQDVWRDLLVAIKPIGDALLNVGKDIMPLLNDALTSLQPAIEELAEFLGSELQSAAVELIPRIQEELVPALMRFSDWIINTGIPALLQFSSFIWNEVIPTLSEWFKWTKENIIPIIIEVAKFIKDEIIPAIAEFAKWIKNTLIPALRDMWTWFSVNIMPLLIRIFQLFSQDGKQAGTIMAQIWTSINEKIQPLINIALPKILELFEIIKTWTIANWPLIQQTIVTIIGFINDIIIAKLTVLQNFWNTWGDTIVSVTSFVFNFIFKIIKKRIKTILKILTVFMKIITGDWEEVWMDALKLLEETWKAIKTATETTLKLMMAAISTTMQQIKNIIVQIWNDIKTAISTKWNEIISTVTSKINQMISSIISGITSAVSDIADSLIDTIKDALKLLGKAVESGGKLFKKLLEIGEDIIDSIADGFEKVKDFASSIISFIKEQLEEVVKSGSEALTAAISVGTAIINGIIQGIEDAKQTLKDMLKGISKLIPDWLADFLGIGSPAKLTIPIGRRIGEGIAVGIAQSGDLIRAATQGIVAPVSLPTTPIPASAAATGAVTNNFNFGGNTINTQVDNAQFEARVMDVIRRNL